MSNLGIQKIEAIADSIAELAKTSKLILKDKKVNVEDLPYLVALLPKLPEIIEPFKDLGEAIEEGKDLDASEVVLLIQKAYAKFKEIEKV